MSKYLALLKAAVDQKRLLEEPSKRSKAAFVGFDGGPGGLFSESHDSLEAWRQALASLDPRRPPGDVPGNRWLEFLEDAHRFLQGRWVTSALELGWEAEDFFGCDPSKPYARIDRLGLVWLLRGRPITAMTADKAAFSTTSGRALTYHRQGSVRERSLPWKLAANDNIDPYHHN
jgi:hypothetical protein